VKHKDLRRFIVDVMRRMHASGLTHGTAGNVSARVPGGFLITPSGVPVDRLRPGLVVEMDEAGQPLPRDARPSSEWRIHHDLYREREDCGAVVHTHSHYAAVLACTHREIPAFHYMIAVAGGSNVRCAPYATFGTQALSDHALAALRGRRACLLANHGVLAIGADPGRALALAAEVEQLASQYFHCLLVGGVELLDDAEMARVLERFREYGPVRAPR
jgi:L-fuculose-phosphate aldolase